jgi:hypothetical protein
MPSSWNDPPDFVSFSHRPLVHLRTFTQSAEGLSGQPYRDFRDFLRFLRRLALSVRLALKLQKKDQFASTH